MEMQFYEPTIEQLLRREVERLPLQNCEVGILEDNPNTNSTTLGCFGLNEKGKPAVQFYTKLIMEEWSRNNAELLRRYSSLEKWVQFIVRHEFRHYQQYQHFTSAGLVWDEVMKTESTFKEGEGPLEKDALSYANGVDRDIELIVQQFQPTEKVYNTNPKTNTKKKKKKK